MHEFDKCRFCQYHNPRSARLDKCTYEYSCMGRAGFILDVIKVIYKAKLYKISVTDVLNLMREATK